MSWVHVDSVDYLTKFTNQQFSRDHRTVMLSLPPAYIICILKTYIIYVILSVLYSHTHTLYIYSINIYKYTTYIFCTNTLYHPKGPQLSLPGVLFNNPHLSIAGQQPEFSVACGRHRPNGVFLVGEDWPLFTRPRVIHTALGSEVLCCRFFPVIYGPIEIGIHLGEVSFNDHSPI